MRRSLLALSLAIVVGVSSLVAQQTGPSTYQTPPKAIVDILDAPPPPGVVGSPTREVMPCCRVARCPRSPSSRNPCSAWPERG